MVAKIVVMSVTDGEDKPVKYPHAFRAAQVMILNKIDLLPYLQFDVERCLSYARHINPRMRIFHISAARGIGLAEWYGWLRDQRGGTDPTLSGSVMKSNEIPMDRDPHLCGSER
ncbi:MAG: hypothetical protein HY000_28580 [Planctomycetes bacterium]|nr:hypothetical protein [Planctomycetota bacterium]